MRSSVLGRLEFVIRLAKATMLLGLYSCAVQASSRTSPGCQSCRTPGYRDQVSGSSFQQDTSRKCPCCAGRRCVLGAAGAERSGTGKDDSGDSGFQQPWETAAGPFLPAFCECGPTRHAPASTGAIPFPWPTGALGSTSSSGTVHDPPPCYSLILPGLGFSVLCDTFPWVLGPDAVHRVPN